MSPFFSVVIPTYNRSDLLRETLDSVDRQEFRDFEIIVVDDGSTEDISSSADRHQTRVTILRQANAGPSAARNRGVRSAGGEYIAFLDSDDLWFPWTLAVYHHIIREHDRPAFVAGCPRLFRDPRELAAESNSPLQTREFADYYGGSDAWRWFGVSSFVIRRDVFIQCGEFSTEMRYGEDADLAMKLGTAAGFVQILRPATFGYRQGAVDQLTGDWKQELPSVQTLVANEIHLHYPGATSVPSNVAASFADIAGRWFSVSSANGSSRRRGDFICSCWPGTCASDSGSSSSDSRLGGYGNKPSAAS